MPNGADDRKSKDQIEARNRADAMVYNTEKLLKEHRDKVSDSDAKTIENALEDVKKAINDGDADKLNAADYTTVQATSLPKRCTKPPTPRAMVRRGGTASAS